MRPHDKKEGEQKKSRPQILIKGDQQAGIYLREFPVENSKDGKSESGEQSPQDTLIYGIGQIESRDDQKDTEHAKKSKHKPGNPEFFLEKEGFEEHCEDWKTGIG